MAKKLDPGTGATLWQNGWLSPEAIEQIAELTGTTASIRGEIVIVGDNLFVVYVAYTPNITDFTPIDAFFADFQLKS